MVDRKARDEMSDALEGYLDDRIGAYEFDQALERIADETKDETVRDLRRELWYCYDDLVDHHVIATRQDWNYLQRILLLLRSNGRVETVPCATEDLRRRYDAVLAPFSSVSEVLAVRRTVPSFARRPYPPAIGERRIRGPVAEGAMWLLGIAGVLVIAPLLLLALLVRPGAVRELVRSDRTITRVVLP